MSAEPRIIPVLLLEGERFVKTTRFRDPVYVGDPINVLSIFNEFEVDELIILYIHAAQSRVPSDTSLLRRYATECFIPLAYGGGLSSIEQITEVFKAGYEKVVLNSLLEEDPETVSLVAKRFGSQAVVGSIDVRGPAVSREVAIRGNRVVVSTDPLEWASRAVDLGVGELLVTSIDQEGTGNGYDLDLIRGIAQGVSVPVIAHGGVGRRSDLAGPLEESGASAVAAGTIFVFQGLERGVLINYPSRAQIRNLLGITS